MGGEEKETLNTRRQDTPGRGIHPHCQDRQWCVRVLCCQSELDTHLSDLFYLTHLKPKLRLYYLLY